MTSLQTLVALSTAALVTACASLGGPGTAPPKPANADEHAGHHPDATSPASTPAMADRMKAMREMHDKMAKAKTPKERQALMDDHMKTMHDGVQMMKAMGRGGRMGGTGSKGGAGDPKGMHSDMTERQQMMEARMDMMQTMMEMMMQRMPGPSVPPAAK
jgi:hypothetical protein